MKWQCLKFNLMPLTYKIKFLGNTKKGKSKLHYGHDYHVVFKNTICLEST